MSEGRRDGVMATQHPGHGAGTLRKLEGLRLVERQCLYISMKNRPFPYYHIECNAGPGYYSALGCYGSPAVFMEEALKAERVYRLFCCDSNPGTIEKLRSVLDGIARPPGSEVRIEAYDNNDFLREVVGPAIEMENRRPECAVGSGLIDPNGFPHGFPVEGAPWFFGKHRRIDPIVNLNASLFARALGCKASEREAIRKGFAHWPDLWGAIEPLDRPHWWVRNLPDRRLVKNERFVMLLGRTLKPDREKFADFFPVKSAEGERILREMKRVAVEQLEFDFMRKEGQ